MASTAGLGSSATWLETDVSLAGTTMSKANQRSRPSLLGAVVWPGKWGMLFEQPAPEQGTRLGRPGARSGLGPLSLKSDWDEPVTIRSSRCESRANGSCRETTWWLQPARTGPGAVPRPRTSSRPAPVIHFVDRLDGRVVIPPSPLRVLDQHQPEIQGPSIVTLIWSRDRLIAVAYTVRRRPCKRATQKFTRECSMAHIKVRECAPVVVGPMAGYPEAQKRLGGLALSLCGRNA